MRDFHAQEGESCWAADWCFPHQRHQGQVLSLTPSSLTSSDTVATPRGCSMCTSPSPVLSFSSPAHAVDSGSFPALVEKRSLQFTKTHSAPLFPSVNAYNQHFAPLHLLRDAENT